MRSSTTIGTAARAGLLAVLLALPATPAGAQALGGAGDRANPSGARLGAKPPRRGRTFNNIHDAPGHRSGSGYGYSGYNGYGYGGYVGYGYAGNGSYGYGGYNGYGYGSSNVPWGSGFANPYAGFANPYAGFMNPYAGFANPGAGWVGF